MTVVESMEVGSWEDPWDAVPVIGAGVRAAPSRQGRELIPEGTAAEVVVRCNGAGVPREVVHRGGVHHVVEPPVRWYERWKWWESEDRVPRESRISMVDRELWQVQALRGGAAAPCTFRLVRNQVSDQWQLLGVTLG
ncbi:hypothetical protein [Kocuria salsicia]|uniref:hypothetical protein n=1 Tax=Kocuria salsicia TaxID=664639 RepID=UPI0033F833DB